VRSRFLVGLGAWLLGAVAATSGSMIAVNQLANGLLSQGTQQGSFTVSSDLDAGSQPHAATHTQRSTSGTAARHRHRHRHPHVVVSPSPSVSPSSQGSLLVSADGAVMAVCQAGQARLLYWSPDQGYEADDVMRGPATVASVTFERQGAELTMRVSCNGSTPVAQSSTDDNGHDN
jgi:hypothetical protein